MTPLLTFITLTLTGSVLFLLGWTLGFSSGLKRGIFGPPVTLKCSNDMYEVDPIKRVAEEARAKEALFMEEHDGMSSAEYFWESGYKDAEDEAMMEEEEEVCLPPHRSR